MRWFYAQLLTAGLSLAFATSSAIASSSAPEFQELDERAVTARYSQAHSYPDSYSFEKRDGWVTVDHLTTGYTNGTSTDSSSTDALFDATEAAEASSSHGLSKRSLLSTARRLFRGMRHKGNARKVVITWYTGHDLLNPSCWANTRWAPSDNSFAAALTANGWGDRPKCFKFVELCHNHRKRCIFVRIVDSCAGCKAGSAHVDLTKAAFRALVPLSVGLTHVHMRGASEPEGWSNALWGPIERVNREALAAQRKEAKAKKAKKSKKSSKSKKHKKSSKKH